MLQGILIIVVFLVIAALMMTKKIPTLLALPLMAVIICIIAGVPAVGTDAEGNAIGWLQTVVENGTVRMGSAIMAVIFGAWLGQLMNKTGVTENIIKKSAELGGDRPLVVTLIMVVAVAILFTTLSGLGSIIMVGSIVLPILVSVGVPAISAACIFLMAFTTGLTFNIANWKSFSSIFGLEIEQIKSFEIYLLIATLIATLVLVFVEFKKNGVKFAFSAPVSDVPETRQLKGVAGTLAMLTPLVPILLVALLKVPVVPAFVAGIIWVLVFTSKSFSKAMNLLVKTCYDGITDAGPAVILMIGIGILYLAVTHSMVKEVLNPFLLAVIPSNRIAYIIFFSLLAPLSLYRGPMNLFGLGSGIAALVIGLARGIQWILTASAIIDPIINSISKPLMAMPKYLTPIAVMIVIALFNGLITSGSAKAMALMPILIPLADLVGMTRQTMILAFQFGDGLTNSAWFTSGTLLIFLTIAGIPLKKWLPCGDISTSIQKDLGRNLKPRNTSWSIWGNWGSPA